MLDGARRSRSWPRPSTACSGSSTPSTCPATSGGSASSPCSATSCSPRSASSSCAASTRAPRPDRSRRGADRRLKIPIVVPSAAHRLGSNPGARRRKPWRDPRSTTESGGSGRPDSALVRSKLRPPSPSAHYVARQRLDERLQCVTAYPLTVVIAPAGSGKTQLMSSWVGRATVPTAWLSLEEMDDDPVELWSGVIAALEQLAPGCSRVATERRVGGATADDGGPRLARRPRCGFGHRLGRRVRRRPPSPVPGGCSVVSRPSCSTFRPGSTSSSSAAPTRPCRSTDSACAASSARCGSPTSASPTPRRDRCSTSLAPDLSEPEIDESARSADGWAAGVQLTGLVGPVGPRRGDGQSPRCRDDVMLRTEDYVWHEVLASGGPRDRRRAHAGRGRRPRQHRASPAAITGDADVRELLAAGGVAGPVRVPARDRGLVPHPSARAGGAAQRARPHDRGTASAMSAPPDGWRQSGEIVERARSVAPRRATTRRPPTARSDARPSCTTRAATR